jgi:nickel/cobalt transporter (NiCoT) family protein
MSTLQPKITRNLPAIKKRVNGLYVFLILSNLIAWIWALITLHDQPALIGTALLAYGFGVRHALDADHIAAIDNVTRKLIQDGKQSVTIGLFFAAGHALVVILASIAIALMAKSVTPYLPVLQGYGGVVSSLASSMFLLAIGCVNLVLLIDIYRAAKHIQSSSSELVLQDENKGHFFARIFRPLFKNIFSSWQMLPLGFLFGLGFETATEVAVLSTTAIHSSQGMDMGIIMLFPVLFAIGMMTVDSADGLLMLKIYGWAFVKPMRKLYYNMSLTLTSTILAFVIASINISSLLSEHFQLQGKFWSLIEQLQEHYSLIGLVVIGVFLMTFLGSGLFYKKRSMHVLSA